MGETEVTRDEARKLLGGYATGSLTEAERKLLFDAALEDQDLFDELATEQVLKEVIEEPGARARLIAALEPEKKQRVWWPWAAAVTVAGLATIGVWLAQRPAPRQEVALNVEKATPAEIAAPATDAVAPSPKPAPAPAIPLQRKTEPAIPPTPPAPATEPLAVANELTVQKQNLPTVIAPLAAPAAADRVAAARSSVLAGAINAPVTTQFLADGRLRITSNGAGTLEVRVGQQVLVQPTPVTAQTVTNVAIPAGVLLVEVRFTPEAQDLIVINVPVQP